jgi:predicted nucleic acid-binding protein
VIVVSNSSPLITFARIGCFDLLRQLFGRVHIALEVEREVVEGGVGRAGAESVRTADWIETHPAADPTELARLHANYPLGKGELATVLLATALNAQLAIIDERAARRLATARNLPVMGCVGILERSHQRGMVTDLRATYSGLLGNGIYIERQILNESLRRLGLPPL